MRLHTLAVSATRLSSRSGWDEFLAVIAIVLWLDHFEKGAALFPHHSLSIGLYRNGSLLNPM